MSARNRVLSFMSQFSSNRDSQSSPMSNAYNHPSQATQLGNPRYEPARQDHPRESTTPSRPDHQYKLEGRESPPSRVQRERASSRPMSMVQTYQPPLMDVSQDTLPELQPIFTFLNSHANKLYQEGYFLKLDDQNTHGRANSDRTWTECFAQLVGTVLSLWDAAELDVAGQDGEVLPKFINLTDASIKMIESLPTRSPNEAPLQNVLSISTAGKNRYLLHFNSHHSLIQWTAGIRLAMFEHATLQEAYTGALIAGKGKALNNINVIMERSKFKTEDWARVRFGAGTPWRRCWCVITPPDEKEMQKLQKQLNKKKSVYDRSRLPVLKGDIKFYDTKKTKKVLPIATITDAYSAFAIYPQSKPLIDASTLVKVEGNITIHSNPPSTTEGFVFVMPEVHPAVTGFEMMLRWLFPVFDTFHLYGRPGRLTASTSDPKSLMFAMPKHRRYGYLEILDVTSLILDQASSSWKEAEWRLRMKELTGKRMTAIESGSRENSRYGSRRSNRNSFGPSQSRVRFDDGASVRSQPSVTWAQGPPQDVPAIIPRTDSAPPTAAGFNPPRPPNHNHQRSMSETNGSNRYEDEPPSRYDGAYEQVPTPPPHNVAVPSGREGSNLRYMDGIGSVERISSEDEVTRVTPTRDLRDLQMTNTPEPVATPPAFSHAPGSLPASKPYHSPELRRANSRMSNATLHQLVGASGGVSGYGASQERPRTGESPRRREPGRYSGEIGSRGVISDATAKEMPANQGGLDEGLVALNRRFSFEQSPSRSNNNSQAQQPPVPAIPIISSGQYHAKQLPATVPYTTTQTQNVPVPNTRTYQPPQVFSRDSDPPVFRTQQPPNAPSHTSQPSNDSVTSTSSQLSRLQTHQSITRKPLPARTSSMQSPTSAATPSSAESVAQNSIDQAAFEMIGQVDNRKLTPLPESQLQRTTSGFSSLYEDTTSSASPQYASTIQSEPRESTERKRTGVMRTVGSSDGAGEHGAGTTTGTSLVPEIDFGPTFNLTSGQSAGRRNPLGPQNPISGFSAAGYRAPQNQNVEWALPGPATNNYYPSDRVSTQRAPPPGSGPQTPDNAVSSSRDAKTPENVHYRNESGDSRTLPWQPGMGSKSPVQRQSITPEQFVQQRAAAAATPLYAHQRQASSTSIRGNTPTPPLSRDRSSDALAQHAHSRNSSADLLQRPGPRDPQTTYGPSGTGDLTTNLSAREQEHFARVTGQPLVQIAQNNSRQGASGGGLVGAIEIREREKQQMKAGINSQAVQHAIAQRQQHGLQQQYADQHSLEHIPPQQLNGQHPVQPLSPAQAQSQRQQAWGVSPAANVFAQGGGWSAPSPAYVTPREQGRQSPQFSPGQQPQYFGQQIPQQGQGRGGTGGYRGQGY